ncbi:thioredoxin-like [Musca vetustissima]|uniref:thioredoxin-like n=1 Tax=Musca vetustissima TaxID=27455 RepID=UPI002AB77194|nr:thioredoxin-like [Musca vetustissima]
MLQIIKSSLISTLSSFVKSSIAQNLRVVGPGVFASTKRTFSQDPVVWKKYAVNDHEQFDQLVINNGQPVIVDFHAEWCEPCHILTPILNALTEKSKHIDLAIVDVEQNQDLVETFDVKAVPAVLAFCNGVIVDKFIGLVDEKRLEALVKKLKLNNNKSCPMPE